MLGRVPTISINKTEGCQVYLSKDSLNCDIVSAKSSEMNILIPQDDEYVSVKDKGQVETMVASLSAECFPESVTCEVLVLQLYSWLFYRGSFQYRSSSRLSGTVPNW